MILSPYSATDFNGYNLIKKITGKRFNAVIGSNTFIYVVGYALVNLTGVEIIGGENGDHTSVNVLDKTIDPLFGTPDALLRKVADTCNIAKDFYKQESKFPSQLVQNLQVQIIYHSLTEKNIGINFLMDELVEGAVLL